jgi:hypothetical protein
VDIKAQEDVKLIGQNVFNILQFNSSVIVICECLQQLADAIAAQSQRLVQQLNAAEQAKTFFDTNRYDAQFVKEHALELLTYNDSPVAYAFSGIK